MSGALATRVRDRIAIGCKRDKRPNQRPQPTAIGRCGIMRGSNRRG